MEGCSSRLLYAIKDLSDYQIHALLKTDAPDLLLTKSLVNLLYNLLVVQSVETPTHLCKSFEAAVETISSVLDTGTNLPLANNILAANVPVVRLIASACP